MYNKFKIETIYSDKKIKIKFIVTKFEWFIQHYAI